MKLRLLLPTLLLLAATPCLAELNAYQQQVLAGFPAPASKKALQAAYEARKGGRATPAQLNVIRTSETIHEDKLLMACLPPALGQTQSLDDMVGKIVTAGQGPALVADAKKLFDAAEWKSGMSADASAKDQAVAAAIMLATGAKIDANTPPDYAWRALQRRLTLNYYLTYAADGKCKPSPNLKSLLGRGSK